MVFHSHPARHKSMAPRPLPPLLLFIVLLQLLEPAAARPHAHAPSAPTCAGTGEALTLRKPLEFCGGQAGDPSCCNGENDSALREAFVHAFSKSKHPSCAPLVKRKLCTVCFPAWIPDDTALPAPCAALARAVLSSSTGHLSRANVSPSNSICFEKVAAVSYSGLILAPDGSGRALVWNQQGEVWLASMPPTAEAEMETTGVAMPMWVGDSPFIDLSNLARYDEARGLRGLVGMASHPCMDGRLFASYYTTTKSDGDCSGLEAAEASAVSCAMLVVKELSPREGGFEATTVFSLDLPVDQASFSVLGQGGQIFFRPNDPSLYLVTGHGVSAESGFSSSNKKSSHSLLGKILRLHVDHDMPAGTDAEVVFSDLNNPRGCALDYSGSLFCANIDETQREVVYLIFDNNPFSATSAVVLDLERPTAGIAPSSSIVWALHYYQGSADASLSGRYIYVYNSAIWSAAMELPPSSGQHRTTRMLVACSRSTPMPCQEDLIVVSFGEDQSKEGVILATDGVYRIVASTLCAGGVKSFVPTPAPAPASRPSFLNKLAAPLGSVLGVLATAFFIALVMICKQILQADGTDSPGPKIEFECLRGCCSCITCICCLWGGARIRRT